jgi:chromosome segregation ATPase
MANDQPVPAVADASVSDPEGELKKKQDKLKETQDGIVKLNTDAASLQAAIQILAAKVADVRQALAGYDKSSATMKQRLDDYKKLIQQKSSMAQAALKDRAAQIDAKKKDLGNALSAQAALAKTLWDDAGHAATDSQAADKAAQGKQDTYDAQKKTPKDQEASLNEIATLLDQATKAEAQADLSAMYFLVGEAKDVADKLDELGILSPENYTKALRSAQDDMENAKADAAAKKANADQLSTAYKAAKQKVDAAYNSRRADLLNSIKDINLKAA